MESKNISAKFTWKKHRKTEYGGKCKKLSIINLIDSLSSLNLIFLSLEKFSDRDDVTSDKVNVRPEIRQNFLFEKFV